MHPTVVAIMDHLTVYTRQRNLDAAGGARTNLNTATRASLADALAGFSAEQIDAILAARANRPFESVGELLTRSLRLRDKDGKMRTIRIAPAELRPVVDRISVTGAPVLLGLVNVNTAGPAVLGALPSLTDADVAAIMDRRTQLAEADPGVGIGWLLDVLSAEAFAKAAPHVTTRSRQFRVRIEVVPDRPGTPGGAGGRALGLGVIERGAGRCGVLYWLHWAAIGEDGAAARL
jgi:DNA uptake protein ComE-like DNA-binding protein